MYSPRNFAVETQKRSLMVYILESISSILTFQNTPACAYGDIFFLISEKACSYSYDIYSILEYFFEKP